MLKDLQRILIRAMTSGRPLEVLRDAELPPEDRALLDRADTDGLVLTALLVQKLRFERIVRGDKRAEAWFDRDPENFTAAFRVYNSKVPPREYFPRQEAEAFRAFCMERKLWTGEPS